jgi:prevent-host-death family protein
VPQKRKGSSRAAMLKSGRSVGAYEAKTHLSELLDEVEKHGVTVVITRNGKEVAELRKPSAADRRNVVDTLVRIREIAGGATLGGVTIRSLIEEGRRF